MSVKIIIDKNIPDYSIFTDSLKSDVEIIDFFKSDVKINAIRVGFVWKNNIKIMPWGTTTYNNSKWFTQEFVDFIACNSTISIDLITCNLNSDDFIDELTQIKQLFPNVTIEYSIDQTGSFPGNWILESNNTDIKSIYFTDKIDSWTHTLLYYPYYASGFSKIPIIYNTPAVLKGISGSGYTSTDISGVIGVFSNQGASAALKSNGSVITWGESNYGANSSDVSSNISSGVINIFSTFNAFAALKSNGSVITWGNSSFGGNSSSVQSDLSSGVVNIFNTETAFAALKSNGSVITWGGNGGNSSSVQTDISSGVVNIFSTGGAFAALKLDGSVITWSDPNTGGDSSSVKSSLTSGVVNIINTVFAFAALKSNGSVITWGNSANGGNSSLSVQSSLSSGVVNIFSTRGSFAALKSNGSVITWGNSLYGGNSSDVSSNISSGVINIFSTYYAFAALKSNGSVITWGDWGGNSSSVQSDLSSGVVNIFSTTEAFAALKSNGSVITWGNSSFGGNSSSVQSSLSSGVVNIFSTWNSFTALKSDGSIITWGQFNYSSSGNSISYAYSVSNFAPNFGYTSTLNPIPLTPTFGLKANGLLYFTQSDYISSSISSFEYKITNLDISLQSFNWNTLNPTTNKITNLQPSKEYSLLLRAKNLVAPGDYNYFSVSSDSLGEILLINSLKPPVIPNQITDLSATIGANQNTATLNWSTPFDGGTPIIGYKITYSGTTYDTRSTSNNYTASGLIFGTEYTFIVQAYNLAGNALYSDPQSATPYTIPNQITDLSANPSNQSITLNWTTPESNGRPITSYDISINGTITNYLISYINVNGSQSSLLIGSLTNDMVYNFQLRPNNLAGNALYSDPQSAIPFTVPNQITDLSANPSNQNITLNWTTPQSNGRPITSYDISINGTITNYLISSINVNGSQSSLLIGSLTNDMVYNFQIRPNNLAGNALYSDPQSAIPFTVPNQITDLDRVVGCEYIRLVWSTPQSNGRPIDKYQIDCSGVIYEPTISQITQLQDTSLNTYTISGLTDGIEYIFKIKAHNEAGYATNYSNQVSGIPCSTPNEILDLSGVISMNKIKLTWSLQDSIEPILGYIISSNGQTLDLSASDISTNGTICNYTIEGLQINTIYTFNVMSYNEVGFSPQSNNLVISTYLPTVITDLSGTVGLELVHLSWSAQQEYPDTIVSGYKILYGGISLELELSKLQIVNNIISHTIYRLDPQISYTFEVQGYNASGYAELSNQISLQTVSQSAFLSNTINLFLDNSLNNTIVIPPSNSTPFEINTTITQEQIATTSDPSGNKLEIDIGSDLVGAFVLFSLIPQEQIQTNEPETDFTSGFFFKVIDDSGNSLISQEKPVTITLTLNSSMQRVDLVKYDGISNITIYAYKIKPVDDAFPDGPCLYQATFTTNSFWFINQNQYIQSGGDPYIRPLRGPQYLLPNDLTYVNLLSDSTNNFELNAKTSLLSKGNFLPVIYANSSYYLAEKIDYLFKYTYYTQLYIKCGDENILIHADTLKYIKNKDTFNKIKIEELVLNQGIYSLVHEKYYPLFQTTKGLKITCCGYTIKLVSDIMTDERNHIMIKTSNSLDSCKGGMIEKNQICKLLDIRSSKAELYQWPAEYLTHTQSFTI